jgi:adenosyl cobinamide kinase/adenosyl cobinamide phosphate guanylyltransferase
MPLVVLIGGARSGKSQLAVRLADACQQVVVFVATAEARDEEMAARIEHHRQARPETWVTVEEPLRLGRALERVEPTSCVVIDCLALWVANLLEERAAAEVEEEAAAAASAAAARAGLTVAVTNEVGLGLVPINALGRAYRDLLGRVNAIWADAAERVLLVVAGRTLPLERSTLLRIDGE